MTNQLRNGLAITGVGFLIIIGFLWYFAGNSNMVMPPPTPVGQPAFTSAKVIVDNVGPNSIVTSGMEITGKARLYYFEASFPVNLVDANGKIILGTYAQAQGDWMTEEFVPFVVQNFVFEKPTTSTGKLILSKDNPSALPEYDEQVEIPVRFADYGSPINTSKCVVSGCSGQICGEEEMVSTCEYRAEYACYKSAKCERQQTGQCGWTETEGLKMCLKNSSSNGQL